MGNPRGKGCGYGNIHNEGNLMSLGRTDYDCAIQVKKGIAPLACTVPPQEGYISLQHLNLSGNHYT